MSLKKITESIIPLQQMVLNLMFPPLSESYLFDGNGSNAIVPVSEAFSEAHILWMAVPKRNKSARMKKFERNRPWKIPKDIPYTTCSKCGSPRLVYFMCEVCYSKVRESTIAVQQETIEFLEKRKLDSKKKILEYTYKPAAYEDKVKPYLEKFTLERLKPKPVEPVDEAWKSTINDYKKWYLEDGDPVVKPKSDDHIEVITKDSTKEISEPTDK